jgi:hypothetical protein
MNDKQRIVLIIGLFLFAVTALFPAYAGVYQTGGDNLKFYLGHYFVLIPPSENIVAILSGDVQAPETTHSSNLPWEDRLARGNVQNPPLPPETDYPWIYTYVLLSETLLELLGVVALTCMLMILLMHRKQVGSSEFPLPR